MSSPAVAAAPAAAPSSSSAVAGAGPAGTAPAAMAATPAVPYASSSLYVGDLAPDVTEGKLFELFNQVGPVASIRVCRDSVTRRSLGYAYVNFHSVADAERAIETLNNSVIGGKTCRIMWSNRDPTIRKSGAGNIFIKNLDLSIDMKQLQDTFEVFGPILSCKVVLNEKNESKGYGFVHFEKEESATMAIEKVNGKMLLGKVVTVARFMNKKERIAAMGDPKEKYNNIYTKNLPDKIDTVEALKDMFKEYGAISSAFLNKDKLGKPFGFVCFATPEAAKAAVDAMHGKEIEGKTLFVGRAQKKSERAAELKQKLEMVRQERLSKFHGVNLYVKNIDDTIDDDKLREEFKQFGTISSAKIMVDDKGISRGFGFVCFSAPEEATRAVSEMNGRMLAGKPLFVALAQRKDMRRAQLEQQWARRAKPAAAGMPGQMPVPAGMYPGAPAAPMFYAAQSPMHPGGFIYPQHQMMNARARGAPWPGAPQFPPGAGPVPNMHGQFMVPVQPGQPGRPVPLSALPGGPGGPGMVGVPNPGAGAGVGPGNPGGPNRRQGGNQGPNGMPRQGGPGMPNPNNPQGPRGPGMNPGRGPAGRGPAGGPAMMDPQVQMQMMMAAQQQQQQQQQQPQMAVPLHDLVNSPLDAKSISSLPPDQQKLVVGEKLYPLIHASQPELAGKITGMLLDSYFTEEIIHLIETPESLAAKIQEALQVLEQHSQGGANKA